MAYCHRYPGSANQRRYADAHIRAIAFVRLCQDAGLALDDIRVLVDPTQPRHAWQQAIRTRLVQLDADIARLRRARETLHGALRCKADHPAIECPYVQQQLEDRLDIEPTAGSDPPQWTRRQ